MFMRAFFKSLNRVFDNVVQHFFQKLLKLPSNSTASKFLNVPNIVSNFKLIILRFKLLDLNESFHNELKELHSVCGSENIALLCFKRVSFLCK